MEVRLSGAHLLLFCCCYRSPTPTEFSDENNDKLNRLLKAIGKNNYTHRCIVGDFNYRDINWPSWTTHHNEESAEFKFIEAIRDSYLYQHVEKPTRRRGNDDPSLIDLIFTDEEMQVSDLHHHPPLGKSDHSLLTFNFHCYIDYSKPKEIYQYKKGNYEAMRNQLSNSNWVTQYMTEVKDSTIEEIWSSLKDKLLDLTSQFIPKRTVSGTPAWKEKGTFPISKPTRDAIQLKNKTHRQWMSALNRDDSESARLLYTRARNKVKSFIRRDKRLFEKGIAMKSKTNPKSFWSHARRKLKTKPGVAPLLEKVQDSGSLKFDDKEKANILQAQFSSVFTREPPGHVPTMPNRTNSSILNLQITEDMVKTKLQALNPNKSVGPDNIHPQLLAELTDHIASPIAFLFNETLIRGSLPNDWKLANVSPIFKKGPKNRAENYRPISLTAILCKLMESFVRDKILEHLQKNKLLSHKQHGFISGRSTVTQLLNYLDKCVGIIAEGGIVDAIYLDFAKAFDTVPYRRLLGKLQAYGIKGHILNWITEYLNDRSQVVLVNGEKSNPAPVISGIPQGTVLGPLLFVIYINDLLDNVKSDGFLFADDTKIFHEVTSREDALILQEDINKLEVWSNKWLLNFHPDKCHVLTLGKFQNIMHTQRYTISGQELEHVFDEKDLGVIFDSDLSFDEHISRITQKANGIVGLIRRTFSYLDTKSFTNLYTSFVRPHLEYAQSIWAPHLVKHINMLENVQIRATKLVDGLHNLDYGERLAKLNIPTLVYRRLRGDIIEVFKHFHTYDREILSSSFHPRQRTSRKHNFQLHHSKLKDGARGVQSNSFYHRIVKTWNNLPQHVVNARNINTFKNSLDDYLSNEAIKFDHRALLVIDS